MAADTALFTPENVERINGRFLFVGRLNAQKGLADLLQALEWTPPHTTLDTVGSGPEEPELRALASRLGIAKRLNWLGGVTRQQLPPIYRRAQAIVLPARNE